MVIRDRSDRVIGESLTVMRRGFQGPRQARVAAPLKRSDQAVRQVLTAQGLTDCGTVSYYALNMAMTAVDATVTRDVTVNGGGVWKLTLFAENGEVVDVQVLRTRDRFLQPIDEASEALARLGYVDDTWRDLGDERWSAQLTVS